MGSVLTHLSEGSKRRMSVDSQKGESWNMSDDILIHVLSFVPAADLLNSCCRVCREWNSLIAGHIIWKRKCERDGKYIPRHVPKTIPNNYYRSIYLKNPYGKNLVRNSYGLEKLNHWTVSSNGGEGWVAEDIPAGADPVPNDAGGVSCFATSYGECAKYQIIDLIAEGVQEEVIDEVHPTIEVGEWHAARFDCGSLYDLKVILLDDEDRELDSFAYGPFREEQWAGRAWTKVQYEFTDYPKGVRKIYFEHSGRDTQFWAGHYGSKMTGAYVKFIFKK